MYDEQKKEEKDTQNTRIKEAEDGVSKIFYHIRKNRVPYLEIK